VGELALRGAAGWQDIRELRLGERWLARFLRVIGRDTDGFIWWGTRRSLESETICRTEIPSALRRARRRRRRPYPVVPLFVDLAPGSDRNVLEESLGRDEADLLLGLQGLVKDKNESLRGFARRAARTYMKDVVRRRAGKTLHVEISGGRQPTLKQDLVIDWRELLDERGDPSSAESLTIMIEILADIREAAQEASRRPRIVVEPHLRLPLAALVGWEWNSARPVELDIRQVSPGRSFVVAAATRRPVRLPDAEEIDVPGGGSGPAVVAVSIGKSLAATTARYAVDVEAAEGRHLHLPLGDGALLDDARINALSDWVVRELARINDLGHEKHLILLGPVSLATRIGASAHGTGRTWIPFWDGEFGYRGGVSIGGSSFPGRAS
jgi:hypothetical protein